MKWLETMRAMPRPLMQWLLIALVWPLWFVLGTVEAIFPGTGATVQNMILSGMKGMPNEAWAAIIILGLGAQAYRTIEKRGQTNLNEEEPRP